MKVQVGGDWPSKAVFGALVLPVGSENGQLTLAAPAMNVSLELVRKVLALAEQAGFTAKPGSTFFAPLLDDSPASAIVLVGIGGKGELNAESLSRAAGAGARVARSLGVSNLTISIPERASGLDQQSAIEAAVLGSELALYRFVKYRGKAANSTDDRKEIEELTLLARDVSNDLATHALERASAIANGVKLARDLSNEPGSTLTPAKFAEVAADVAGANGLSIEVLEPDQLRELGANAILTVGSGSTNPPRLIRISYRPEVADASRRIVGLVGKAITFDTGGYSIKPYEGMLEMKGDMAGGAAVLGAMSALRQLACPFPVEATICAAENMISGEAFRPGDIIVGMNGVTMEILSTDAEGRLVLADGLVDTARRGATELIDLATLTGAAVVALGEGATALFSNDDDLAEQLLSAAKATGERTWRMPLFPELEEKIKGDVGDIKNTGGRQGGAITGALFLQHFCEGLPWAHLDIAGAARQSKASAIGPKGATGVGVQTLLRFLAP
jgi:leucyl aminopeptidase